MDIKHKLHQCKILDADRGKPIVAVVSTQDVDSDGDVIYQAESERGQGWKLDGFNKRGGRIYWMHNPFMPNLAKASATVDDGRLLLSVSFDPDDPDAVKLDRKIRGGYIDEWSVGFVPNMDKSEPNSHGGHNIYEAELWEVSVVNQGANPETATLQKSFFQDAADIVKMYEDRIKNLETLVMRMSNEKQADREHVLREAYEAINQIRSRV